MPTPLENNIRRFLADYLSGAIDLRNFYGWLVSSTWDAHLDDPGAADLANTIKFYIAELTNGHRTEPELKGLLRPLAQTFELRVGPVNTGVAVSTSESGRVYTLRSPLQETAKVPQGWLVTNGQVSRLPAHLCAHR